LEQGLGLVFTGDGQGKTTARPWSGVAHASAHGERVAVVQLSSKGGWQPGEAKALEIFRPDALVWQSLGKAHNHWETQEPRTGDRH